MELKLIELLMTEPFIVIVLAILVWLLTYIVKKPIKAHTLKIKDPQKQKLANKWILLIPFVLSFILFYLYLGLTTRLWISNFELALSTAFSIAIISITIYNVFEGIRGRKSEYELDPDGIALYNLLLIYAKDKNKVKLLLDQCKDNYYNHDFEISDTVKGWLPASVDDDVVKTVVKSIQMYFKNYSKKEGFVNEEIL